MSTDVWWIGLVTSILLFQLVSIPALILRKNDLADVLWGPAFSITAWASLHFGTTSEWMEINGRSKVVFLLVALWSLRLFVHVGWRNLSHRVEDVRYNNWRKQWGPSWVWRSYLQVFVLQPLILYVFLLPVLLIIASPSQPLTILAWAGVALWIFGFTFEALADEQLRRFKKIPDNKGKLMTSGLWSWTRHPNYFGEVVQWWGIWLLALDLPYGWATLVSPLGVTYLLLRVSGVSMLDDLMRNRPGYAEYMLKTSSFFPLPPRK